MKLARVIVFSADVPKLARWYIDVVGLKATEISDGWADLGALALHSGGRKRTRDCGHKLVFHSKDVSRARAGLVKRGAGMGPVRKFGALHLCDGRDPEGNVFQVSNR